MADSSPCYPQRPCEGRSSQADEFETLPCTGKHFYCSVSDSGRKKGQICYVRNSTLLVGLTERVVPGQMDWIDSATISDSFSSKSEISFRSDTMVA